MKWIDVIASNVKYSETQAKAMFRSSDWTDDRFKLLESLLEPYDPEAQIAKMMGEEPKGVKSIRETAAATECLGAMNLKNNGEVHWYNRFRSVQEESKICVFEDLKDQIPSNIKRVIVNERAINFVNSSLVGRYSSIFPAVDYKTGKTAKDGIKLFCVPTPATKNLPSYYNTCQTAFMNKDGHLVISMPFMQSVFDFAVLTGFETGSQFIKSSGLPDPYGYVEFILMHEYYHFLYGDFYHESSTLMDLKPTGKEINWFADFRSNYRLVKLGFDQLPLGLFSHELNFDFFDSPRELLLKLREELKKLPKDDKGNGGENQTGDGDAENRHVQSQDDHTDQSGELRESDNSQVKEESSDKDGKGSKSDQEQKDAADKDGKGSKSDQEQKDAEDAADKAVKEANEKAKKEAEENEKAKNADEKAADPNNPEAGKKQQRQRNTGKGTSRNVTNNATSFIKVESKPTMSWKALLHKLVGNIIVDETSTYRKIKNAGTAAVLNRQGVPAALKPSTVDVLGSKLSTVIDTSGSMSAYIDKAYSELKSLFKLSKDDITPKLTHYVFSNDFSCYDLNLVERTGQQLKFDPNKHVHKPLGPKNREVYDKALSSSYYQGTEFNNELMAALKTDLKKKSYMLLISDSDVLGGVNLESLKSLMHYAKTHQTEMFVIFDSRNTWLMAKDAFGGMIPKTFSHFD